MRRAGPWHGDNPRSVPCPACNAPVGHPCRRTSRPGLHHPSRIAAARLAGDGDRARKLRVNREWLRP
jgi:hypothetical protein